MDPETLEMVADLKKHEDMTMMEQREELEGAEGGNDKCWLAMKAAWDTLAEYCGGAGVPIDMEGMSFTVPPGVIELIQAHPELSRDERIDMVVDTMWCTETATNMCETLFGTERGTTEHAECLERVTVGLAAKVVG